MLKNYPFSKAELLAWLRLLHKGDESKALELISQLANADKEATAGVLLSSKALDQLGRLSEELAEKVRLVKQEEGEELKRQRRFQARLREFYKRDDKDR